MSEMIEVKLAKVVNIRQKIFGKLDGFNIKTRPTRHSALEQLKLNQRVQYVLLVDSSPVPADRLIEAGMIKPCKRKTRKGNQSSLVHRSEGSGIHLPGACSTVA